MTARRRRRDRGRRRGLRGRPAPGRLSTLRVALIEARGDVGDGTSKANTAILHTGFDAMPGSLESRLVARGYALLSRLRADDRHPRGAHRRGARGLDATRSSTRPADPAARRRAKNGYDPCVLVTADEVYALVPASRARSPRRAAPCPASRSSARGPRRSRYATEAAAQRRAPAAGHPRDRRCERRAGGITTLRTDGRATCRRDGSSTPPGSAATSSTGCSGTTGSPSCRGAASCSSSTSSPGRWSPRSCCPVPSSKGKGVLVSPTIYGNVMLGPTAEDLDDRTDTSTSEAGFDVPADQGPRAHAGAARRGGHRQLRRACAPRPSTATTSSTSMRRSATSCLGGIRSTGLTASMALAEHVASLLAVGRPGAAPRAPTCPPAADAQHRRGVPAAVPGRRAHRRRPGVRRHRLLLRACHRGRDPRCARLIPCRPSTSTGCAGARGR